MDQKVTPPCYPVGLALWRKLQSEMWVAVHDDVKDGESWDQLILALESMLIQARANKDGKWKIPAPDEG